MVKIFAKYNTDEKVIINAPTDIKNSKITTYLEKKYGGNWFLVDELHPGESVLIKDGVKYKGFEPNILRYISTLETILI